MPACGDDDDPSFADLVAGGKVPMSPNRSPVSNPVASATTDTQLLGNVLELDHPACESDKTMWSIPSLADRKFQRLKRSAAEERFDLHGMTAGQAWNFLEERLTECIMQGISRVEIVHGAGTGKLKRKVRGWLERSGWVLGYVEVRHNPHSVIALLKKRG